VGHGAINGKGVIQGPCRRCLSASRRWREIHSRTPYPTAKPTIRAITISINDERLTENNPECPAIPLRSAGQWEELAMKTTILAYLIALGGIALIVLGFWGLYNRITERVAERRSRDYVPTLQTIIVGFGLIGLAQAMRLLLLIFAATYFPH
jgi:hypothetical protein